MMCWRYCYCECEGQQVKIMQTFKSNIIEIYGVKGEVWLQALPSMVDAISKQYGLTALRPVSNMSFNYVASGYQNEKAVILKLGLDTLALSKEADCLKAFLNYGAVKVLAYDEGMILMKKADPGVTLKTFFPGNDKQAVSVLCDTLKQLHAAPIPEDHHFLTLKTVLSVLDHELDIPSDILLKARQLRDHLLESSDADVLLHGDLHHDNVLKQNDQWLAIDPKGFIGAPVFDVCAFLMNPMPTLLKQTNVVDMINLRIKHCADLLSFSEKQIKDWLYVKVVLGWAWALEDNMETAYFSTLIKVYDEF